MIAIMISIKPYWYAKILNGKKNIEVRKNKALAKAIQKLIDAQGYALILGYCTKGENLYPVLNFPDRRGNHNLKPFTDYHLGECCGVSLNGKVPALLICRKVEDFGRKYAFAYKDDHFYEILKKACMDTEELGKYYQPKRSDWKNGKVHLYAIHISQLEIFDKPKKLDDFRKPTKYCNKDCSNCDFAWFNRRTKEWESECSITKAPQNFCYVEVEE